MLGGRPQGRPLPGPTSRATELLPRPALVPPPRPRQGFPGRASLGEEMRPAAALDLATASQDPAAAGDGFSGAINYLGLTRTGPLSSWRGRMTH
jgi:hypothetical protein